MILKNYNVYFFFILLIGVTVLVFFLFKPFVMPFLVAAILARLFYPLYLALMKGTGDKKGLSSITACLVVALVIVIPLVLISMMAINEISQMLDKVSGDRSDLRRIASSFVETLSLFPVIGEVELEKFINQETILSGVKNFSQGALGLLQSAYRGVIHFVFVTFIMFFSLFYLFIDGNRILTKIIELSPLRDHYENILIDKFNSIVRATLKGTLLIALVQGLLTFILFWLTGVSSPVMLGLLTVVASVIPAVGSFLVWFPTGIVMIIVGYPLEGIIILLFGSLVISTIDNFLRPKLVGRDTKMHPLLILFSTLGGITLFGAAGFLVGPIIMSLCLALWEIYSLEFKQQLQKFNA